MLWGRYCRGLTQQQIQHVDVVQFTIGNLNEGWVVDPQVSQDMQLDGRFRGPKQCLREN